MYDELVKRLRAQAEVGRFFTGEGMIYDEAADAIEELMRRCEQFQYMPLPAWIPCSKKYPDMDERVLVYTMGHEYHVWDCMSNRGDSYFWEDEDGLYRNKYEVVAWMPLPQPYKGEGKTMTKEEGE